MALFELDVTPSEMVLGLVNLMIYLVCPVLLIWAVNTLFGADIPYLFNTWLAGLVLVLIARFIIKGSLWKISPLNDSYLDEEEERFFWEESMMGEMDDEECEPRECRRNGNVIFHPALQDERLGPPDSNR